MAGSQQPLHQPLLPVSAAFEENERQSRKHLCCFCCCNMRQTVIWIQIFFGIIWSIAWLISYGMGYYKQWTSDPQIIADLSTAYWKVSIINGVKIAVALIVIAGATLYKPSLVFVGAIFTIIESILIPLYIYPVAREFYPSPWWYIAWPIIYGLLILYPHVVLIYEMKTGVWEEPNFSE